MRTAEWIVLVFLAYLMLVAWARAVGPAKAGRPRPSVGPAEAGRPLPRPRGRTRRLTLLALALGLAIVRLAGAPEGAITTTLRDWLPAFYVIAGYWLSGLLFDRPSVRVERALAALDYRLFDAIDLDRRIRHAPRAVLEYLELAYLSCYPLVPAGFAVLFFSPHRAQADRYWSIVLLAELASYAVLPWIQTRPPRAFEGSSEMDRRRPAVRWLNLAVLRHGSIQANTIPSGHAAGALAVTLAVAPLLPAWGVVFGVLAVSIAAGSVVGRYHYAADAVLGFLVAIAAWGLVAGGVIPAGS